MPKTITLLESEKINGSYLVFTENVELAESTNSFKIEETEIAEVDIQEGEGGAAKKALKVRIKAIHAGRTGNHHIFKADKLRGSEESHTGVHSFTYPYNKPMLTHHNTEGEPVGRIVFAEYSEEESGVCIIEVIVTDPDAMEKVRDGRYNTVSIGCRTNSAKCNICGVDRMEEWCAHRRGIEYEGVVCGWELGDLYFYECSFVNVPADTRAHTLSWEEIDYDKYSESQDDAQHIEEDIDAGLTIVANQNEDGSSIDEEEQADPTVEPTVEDPIAEGVEPEAEGELNHTESTSSEEIGGFNQDEIVQKLQEQIKIILKDEIATSLEPITLQMKESDKLRRAIAQNNASIEKTSALAEKALTAMKDIYCRLQGYLENEDTEDFDIAWSIDQLKENIDTLFTRIEDVSTLQENYRVEQKHAGGSVIEEKPNSTKSVSEKHADAMHAFLTARRF